jgi:hypothetical protein
MSAFNHVKNAKVRAYLKSDKSTTLDKAGSMIDIAVVAFQSDEQNQSLDARVLEMRQSSLEEAEFALGQRDSVGVRIALREFWSI